MKTLEIIGYKRANLGKSDANYIRGEGNVPCVLYGGDEQIHFYAPGYLFRDLVYTEDAHFVNLTVDGTTYSCKLQDIQFHPVSEVILHADFLLLKDDRPIKMEIPVAYKGNSPGVVKGGKLIPKIRRMTVRAFPQNMPEKITVDISKLELGKSVKVSEIKEENFEILNSKSNPVAGVEVPRAMRGKGEAAEEG